MQNCSQKKEKKFTKISWLLLPLKCWSPSQFCFELAFFLNITIYFKYNALSLLHINHFHGMGTTERKVMDSNPVNPIRSWGGDPRWFRTLTTSLILKQTPPNLATFPEIYLATIWCGISRSKQFDVSMVTYFDSHVFWNFDFLAIFSQNFPFFFVILTAFRSFYFYLMVFVSFLINFDFFFEV